MIIFDYVRQLLVNLWAFYTHLSEVRTKSRVRFYTSSYSYKYGISFDDTHGHWNRVTTSSNWYLVLLLLVQVIQYVRRTSICHNRKLIDAKVDLYLYSTGTCNVDELVYNNFFHQSFRNTVKSIKIYVINFGNCYMSPSKSWMSPSTCTPHLFFLFSKCKSMRTWQKI